MRCLLYCLRIGAESNKALLTPPGMNCDSTVREGCINDTIQCPGAGGHDVVTELRVCGCGHNSTGVGMNGIVVVS